MQVLVDVSRFPPSVINLSRNKHLLQVEESLSNKFWLFARFFIRPTTCHATKVARVARQVEGVCISYFTAFKDQLFMMINTLYIVVNAQILCTQFPSFTHFSHFSKCDRSFPIETLLQ